jgi:hypothetical protein
MLTVSVTHFLSYFCPYEIRELNLWWNTFKCPWHLFYFNSFYVSIDMSISCFRLIFITSPW